MARKHRKDLYRPMKWYNFLIYFALIAAGISSMVNSLLYFLLAFADELGLGVVYIICGIALLINGTLLFITRKKMVDMKRSGPRLYIISLILGAIVTLTGSTLGCIGATIEDLISGMISSVFVFIFYLIFIIANAVYFGRRSHLFEKSNKTKK